MKKFYPSERYDSLPRYSSDKLMTLDELNAFY